MKSRHFCSQGQFLVFVLCSLCTFFALLGGWSAAIALGLLAPEGWASPFAVPLFLLSVLLLSLLAGAAAAAAFYPFAQALQQDMVLFDQQLKDMCENRYPSPHSDCGVAELDSVARSICDLGGEVQYSLTNYKESIDAFIHEIKTPLTGIIGYTELLKNEPSLSGETREYLDYILAESTRLNNLSRKIIYFLSVSKQQICWKQQSACHLIESAVLSTRARARLTEVRVLSLCSERAYLYGDEELLTTCLVNLLDNAIKASSPGSTVEVRVLDSDGAVQQIEVCDHGVGIEAKDQKKVFQPFFMLRKNKDPLNNGLGLGLATCQAVAQAHHCNLSLSSAPGKGTTVRLECPWLEYQTRYRAEHLVRETPNCIIPMSPNP